MTPYSMGKQAALEVFGLEKEAVPAWLSRIGLGAKNLFTRQGKNVAPSATGALRSSARAAAKANAKREGRRAAGHTIAKVKPTPQPPTPDQLVGSGAVRPPAGDAGSEALRQQMMANQQAAALSTAEGAAGKGLLSKIPWWGKALGVGGAGYGVYHMMSQPKQPHQEMQEYYGPGTPVGY